MGVAFGVLNGDMMTEPVAIEIDQLPLLGWRGVAFVVVGQFIYEASVPL